MTKFKSAKELKSIAKEVSIGKYGTLIGADLLILAITFGVSLFTGVSNVSSIAFYIFGLLLSFAASVFLGILMSGKAYLYMNLLYSQTVSVSDIFFGFKQQPVSAMKIQAFISGITMIAGIPVSYFTLQFYTNPTIDVYMYVIIGLIVQIIVSVYMDLTYSMSFFLLQDFPERSAAQILATSRRIMKGNRLRLFYLKVTFIPLYILCFIAFIIPILWATVYQYASTCAFYQDLIAGISANSARKNAPEVVDTKITEEKDGDYGLN
ncbi:DUF975 family protein [Butyrivibrio proteoclasticus]|uniref:DUF975 family protein n=1 Tax=Butyrivibrio proteoclasticus TaxID=43305 RepID=UPI00047D591F|nr:DUF975 family protein [Butyrivibrio proteoclasticus]